MNCVKPLRGKLGRTFFFVQRKLQSSFTHSNREQESWWKETGGFPHLNTGGQVGGRDVTMNGRQQQLQNGKYITKCYRPATNSNGQKKQSAFRKNCCFNKFTTEVESAFAPSVFQVRRRGSDRTQTALDECSCRHRFALNSILHFSHFQGQHNFEKNTPRETPLWIPPHVFSF